MSRRVNLFLTVAMISLTIGLLVIGFISFRQRNQIERRIEAASQQQTILRRASPREDRPTIDPSVQTATNVLSDTPSTGMAKKAEKPFPARTRPPGVMELARNHPQLWNYFIASKRAELSRLYLPLLQRLHLSPDQRGQFEDILAAEVARGADIGAATHEQGLEESDVVIAKRRHASREQQNQELTSLLGPTGFKEFQDFDRALPVRKFVDRLASQMAASAPLSGQQADQLEHVLATASESYRQGTWANARSLDWQSTDPRAREILTPQQFVFWQNDPARRDQELRTVYQEAVDRMKGSAGIAPP